METLHTSLTNELVEIAGKGGGGGGHTPVEADDTLGSRQTLRLLIAVSEGPIHSIDDVLLNNVSYTQYPDVSIETRLGTADQTVITGFTSVETTHSPFQPTTLSAGTVQGTNPVEYLTTFTHDVSAARVTMLCPSLVQATSQGDRIGYSVSYAISVRPISSSIWQTVVTDTINGKGSNISWDVRVAQPAASTGNWQIKVTRTSPDDTSDMLHSVLAVQHITDLIDSAETYPYTALIGITVKNANLFGNTEPAVTVIAKGMTYYLPYGYDATARTYPTVWTGNFKALREYTDNPAWAIYYSITTNPDGTPLKWSRNIPRSYVDTGAFYNLAKYCDGLVPDGKGGMEPRFRIDLQYLDRSNIPTYFAALCSVCNAKLVPNNFGQISITWDDPSAAIKHLETNSTVINGKFKYSSNDTEERYNHVTCTFSDRDQLGNTNMAVLQEQSLIDRNGIIPHDLVLQGCTRYSQALRKARYTFWVSSKDTSVITFNKLFGGLTYVAGELIKVLDSDMVSQTPLTAMIIAQQTSGANTILTLDTNITLANEQYSIAAPAGDGVTIIEHAISETNVTTNVVTVTTNANFFIGAPIIFSATTISAKIFKVLGIKKSEESYEVMAVLHSMERYAYIESADTISLPADSGMFGTFTQYAVDAVSNVQVGQYYAETALQDKATLTVTWDYADDFTLKFRPQFGITYSRDNNPSVTQSGFFDRSFDIQNAEPGIYKIQVWAINSVSGMLSVPTLLNYDYRTIAATSTLLPPLQSSVVVPNTVGVVFAEPDLKLQWEYNTVNDTKVDRLKDYVVEVRDYVTSDIKRTYTVDKTASGGGYFTLTYAENIAIFGTATRQFKVRIYSRDMLNDMSNAVEVVPNNTVPAAQTFTILNGVGSVYIRITSLTETDVKGYRVWRGTAAGFTKNDASLVYDGADTYITLNVPDTTPYYYAVAAYDTFGKTNLNIVEDGASHTAVTVDATQYSFSGITFTPNSPTVNKVSWTAGTVSKNNGTPSTIAAGQTPTAWSSGTIYIYYPGTGTALVATNDITLAVTGSIVVATYRGGTDINVGNGKALLDGSNILAGTVGANQIAANSINSGKLVTDSAVITTEAQVGSAVIGNAAIKDVIQSTNFNATSKTGWKIDKAGNLTSYGAVTIASAGTGNARTENNGDVIKVYDSNNVLRVKLGNLA